MGDFSNQIKKWGAKYERRLRAVGRGSVQEVVSIAQRPVGNGGRMRVDTGFLRASIQAGLGAMPRGPTTNDGGYGGKRKYPVGAQIDGTPVPAVLLQWDPAKPIPLYIGWTANYARPREYKDGFLRGAVQKWPTIVRREATRARKIV